MDSHPRSTRHAIMGRVHRSLDWKRSVPEPKLLDIVNLSLDYEEGRDVDPDELSTTRDLVLEVLKNQKCSPSAKVEHGQVVAITEIGSQSR